ncbi:MAG: COX15/CtaA family protein [Nocardioides sp.]
MGVTVWLRRLAWATLVANIVLVVTGGAVRLTGSGLGCPTWPRCNQGSFTPHGALDIHQAIEFGNRTLTFVLAAVAVATYVAARRSGRADLTRLALLLGLAIPLQAVVGGVTVLTDLNPWVVSFHLLASLAIVSVAVLFLWRLDRPFAPAATGPVVRLALATYAVAWAVLYLGTVVTGSGPHAGDAAVPRNGLDPLELSQAHADLVFLFVGLTVGLVFALRSDASSATARRAVAALVAVEVVQAGIGFVQYFADLPIVVVGLHVLGAALVVSAATWVLLATREPGLGGGASPAPPWPGEAPPQG